MTSRIKEEPMMTIKREAGESDLEIAEDSSDDNASYEEVNTPSVITTNYHDTQLAMLGDFEGPHRFSFRLPQEGASAIKPSWEYSDAHDQLFIRMNRVLILQFAFDQSSVDLNDIYIRAVLVYSISDHLTTPVTRCAVHLIEDDPMSKSHAEKDRCLCPMYNLAGHVVRCKSSEAMYCYDPISARHSVLCPVKTSTMLLFSFHCKNSCPKGMHRRATRLVFTLENDRGLILGRKSLHVKISSCPRRDRDKLDKTFHDSAKQSAPPTAPNSQLVTATAAPHHPPPPANHSPAGGDDDDSDSSPQIPGEVIMKIRSEVRNIRQALIVIERRYTHIVDLLNTSLE